jgi:hypothetical protein
MSKATKESLDALHGAIAKALAEKIEKGEATAADLAVARQFLKDNGIDAIPGKGDPLDQLRQAALPFPDAEHIAREAEDDTYH